MTTSTPHQFSITQYHPAIIIMMLMVFGTVAMSMHNTSGVFLYPSTEAYAYLLYGQSIWQSGAELANFPIEGAHPSILWTLLITALSLIPFGYAVPLVVNCLLGAVTLTTFQWTLSSFIVHLPHRWQRLLSVIFGAAVVLCTNLVALLFSGSELVLLTAFSVIAVIGIDRHQRLNELSPGWALIIALLPSIHIQGALISVCALLYLAIRGLFKESFVLFIMTISTYCAFYLLLYGFEPLLELSETIRQGIIQLTQTPPTLNTNTLLQPENLCLCIIAFATLWTIVLPVSNAIRAASFTVGLLLSIHLLMIAFGFPLETSHLWILTLLCGLMVCKWWKLSFLKKPIITLAMVTALLIGFSWTQFPFKKSTSLVSRTTNLYNTEFQLFRYISKFYKRPFAYSDQILLEWNNKQHSLNLKSTPVEFTASQQDIKLDPSLNPRKFSCEIDKLVKKHEIELIVLTPEWKSHTPKNWTLLATLSISADHGFEIYTNTPNATDDILINLKDFEKAIPPETTLVVEQYPMPISALAPSC